MVTVHHLLLTIDTALPCWLGAHIPQGPLPQNPTAHLQAVHSTAVHQEDPQKCGWAYMRIRSAPPWKGRE